MGTKHKRTLSGIRSGSGCLHRAPGLGPETSPQDLAAAAVCALEELPAEFRDAYAREEWGRQVARVLDALCDIANLIGGNPVIEQKARALVRARRIGEITV